MFKRTLCVTCTLWLAAATAGAQNIPVRNSGFESFSGTVAGDWTAVGGTGPGNSAEIDTEVSHSGQSSFRIVHEHPASYTMLSSPVALEIGKLYRLSGWIRTENALADPVGRYPTPVAATLTMESFPFTNNATVIGGTSGWTMSEALFFATQREDRIAIRFGYNGSASGKAWFDDITIEKVEDVTAYVPMETVRWFGPAFRYTDKGWTFVHIEGKPFERGYQYGSLLSREIVAYMDKLAVRANGENPVAGWGNLRTLADALMLRKFDPEYLEEMKGIADGAAAAGGLFRGRAPDLLDIVTVNSAVDIGQLAEGLNKEPHGLSGRSFRPEEDEASAAERLHKCSSFLASGRATKDGRIVFGQLFMWNGYTGVHWDILCDVVPAKGHRLVYETFPGGIHSGADFYINDAGIMIGETTVAQTPFDPDGEPQSSRIRRAAQYAASIDDVMSILTAKNNGLYTNDWLIGDTKTDEIAILLLGTKKHRLWRSGSGDFPGGTEGFYWSNNNAKDPAVRKEYVHDPANAPVDLVFSPWNRDIAFTDFYRRKKGLIDANEAVSLLASSPVNRPHACDGKVTTSAMAEKLVFLANFGKVTMRDKLPEKNSRLIADLPGALPHLSLGYSAVSPVFIAEKLGALRPAPPAGRTKAAVENLDSVRDFYAFDKRSLWMNTVFPASESENWFVSGTAAYWSILNSLSPEPRAAMGALRDQLAEMKCRLLYTASRETSAPPLKSERRYDSYGSYLIPRIRGTYLLHQIRLFLGNGKFASLMGGIHAEFGEKPMTTGEFTAAAEKAGVPRPFVMQWLERSDIPAPDVSTSSVQTQEGWTVAVRVRQEGTPYRFCTSVVIETAAEKIWRRVNVSGADESFTFSVPARPLDVRFNCGNDIPVFQKNMYTFSNYFDDFSSGLIVYGTHRHTEANHASALRFQTVLADQFTETFAPLRQDAALTDADLSSHDLIVLGGKADNALVARLAPPLGIDAGKNFFRWEGKTYGDADDGLFVAMPNPWNPSRVVYLFLGNSALEVYQMTKRFQGLPSWGVWKGDQVTDRGYFSPWYPAPGLAPDVSTSLR